MDNIPPGPLVWWDLQQNHSIGMALETAVNRWSGNFTILCKQNAWNGFAVKLTRLEIEPFTGSRPVTGLSAAPLSMKANADEIRTLTLERAKTFFGLIGDHYREYLGLGKERREDS